MTNLPTRPALRRVLTASLSGMQRAGRGPALLALDLDRFQAVNDSAGIATGERVLMRVARRIVGALPPGATVARISGDEFAVLLPDGSSAEAVATRLLDLLGRPYAVNGHAVTLSVSIGLAMAPEHCADADALLRSADAVTAMPTPARGSTRLISPTTEINAPSNDPDPPDAPPMQAPVPQIHCRSNCLPL